MFSYRIPLFPIILYATIVRQFLTAKYHCHFALFVTAVYTLLSSPSIKDIEKTGLMLEYFVQEIGTLYGIITRYYWRFNVSVNYFSLFMQVNQQ